MEVALPAGRSYLRRHALSDKVLTAQPSTRTCVFLPPSLDLLRSPPRPLRVLPRGEPATASLGPELRGCVPRPGGSTGTACGQGLATRTGQLGTRKEKLKLGAQEGREEREQKLHLDKVEQNKTKTQTCSCLISGSRRRGVQKAP